MRTLKKHKNEIKAMRETHECENEEMIQWKRSQKREWERERDGNKFDKEDIRKWGKRYENVKENTWMRKKIWNSMG